MSVTTAQLKKIWATAREMDMEEETLRDLVEQVSGSRSISSLSKPQAILIIDRLANKTPRSHATKKQLYVIISLEKELGWSENPQRLKAFMKKYAGVDRFEWLTRDKASRLIESLKNVKKRQLQTR